MAAAASLFLANFCSGVGQPRASGVAHLLSDPEQLKSIILIATDFFWQRACGDSIWANMMLGIICWEACKKGFFTL